MVLRQISALLARLSPEQIQRAGNCLGWLLGSGMRFRRGEVQAAIQRCFPEKNPAEVRAVALGMYRHLGALLIEGLRAEMVDLEVMQREVDFEEFEKGRRILDQGRGMIVLTAHVGNFELLAVVAALKGAPLTVITKKLKPEWLNEWWERTRRRFGVKILPARHSYRYCRETLKANGVLGFILDQNMKRKHGVFVDFFGRPACTSPGLAFLSAQCNSPVLPVFMQRLDNGRHRVHVFDPLPPPPSTDKEVIRQATQEYTAIIERFVRAHPEQWIWLHRRWRTQPEEEKRPASPKPAD
jgi:Kdo2-lipid IVA lauroyltransferase/acyltransferase